MIQDRAEHETEQLEGLGQETPMAREKLDTPEMRAKIELAKERARSKVSGDGKTAEDLLNLAPEQRRLDTRT